MYDNIIPKPVSTDSLPCSSTGVGVKINSIAIGTICQHSEFYTPFGWLVLYELAKPRPVTRLYWRSSIATYFCGTYNSLQSFLKSSMKDSTLLAYFEGLLLRDLPHATWLRLQNTSCGEGLSEPRDHGIGSSYSSSS